MGIGAIVSLVAEIPTGVFADMVGRKWAVFLSHLLFTIAMIGTTLATTYWAFLAVTIINSIVNSLYSGSMEALIYDTLKQDREEARFDVWISKMESVTWIGLFVSTVIGGYLYAIHPNYPYYAQAIATGIGTILAWMLIEPKIDSSKFQLREIWDNNLKGFRELFSTPKLRYLTGIFIVIGLGYYIAADLLGQSQSRQYGLDTKVASWVFGIGFVISAVMSHFYPRIKNMLGEFRVFWLSALALLTSFFLAKFVGVGAGMGLIIMRVTSWGTFRNSKSVIINREINSRNRATSLSTLNLLTMLPYGLSASFIGAYIDRTSPNQFAWVLGAGILVALVIVQLLFSRRRLVSVDS